MCRPRRGLRLDHLVYVKRLIPDRVATHFGLDGQADRWSSREGFYWMGVITPTATAAFLIVMGVTIRHAPPESLNVPNPDDWRSAQHYPEAAARIQDGMTLLATMLTFWMSGLWGLIAKAQALNPPRLTERAFVPLMLVFVAVMLVFAHQMSVGWNVP